MAKLTKRSADAARAIGSEIFLWDDELPGLGLRVKKSGAKSFIVQYRNANGRSRRLVQAQNSFVLQARQVQRDRPFREVPEG